MDKERWERIQELFRQAVEHPEAEWPSLLDAACGEDADLQAEVEALLEAYKVRDGFLDGPTFDAPPPDLDEPLAGLECGTMIDRYKLLEKIGEGGFGVVYMAEQRQPVVRKVALKVIKLGMDTRQVIARFEAERQALALMDHPNIARVLDAGATEAGRPYFVMELVRGDPITDYCDANRLDTAKRLELFIDVCGAIQHAHQKGVIHRDIKPSNVMITMHDDKAVVKVIDFGVAKATQHRLTEKTLFTEFRQLLGTPAYMSPEQTQMSGLDVDTRSDIYSLGVLLYELLTGRTPFDTEELVSAGHDEMRRRVREDEPPTPSRRLSTLGRAELSKVATAHGAEPGTTGNWIRRDLDWIVMKALEKDRTRRYETANGFGRDVRRYLDHEPVSAVAPTALYRFRKFARRNKGALVAGSVILALLVGGTAMSTWQMILAIEAREDAEQGRSREAILRVQAEEGQARARAEEMRQHLIAYGADMKVAQMALEENNLGHARRLLERYAPQPGAEDFRGIEWRYLWQASRGDEIHSFAHGCRVSGLAVCPNGDRMVTLGHDRKLRVFALDSRKVVEEYEIDRAPFEDRAALSFSPDAKLFAADTSDGVTIWNVRSWQIVQKLEDSAGPISFSPDSTRLAAIAGDGIRVWDTDSWTSRIVGSGMGIAPANFQCLTFAPDGARVIFSRSTYTDPRGRLELWNVESGDRTAAPDGIGRPVALAFSKQGALAAGLWDGGVAVWDLKAPTLTHKFHADDGYVFGLAFLVEKGGREILATAGINQVIRLWDAETFREIGSLKGHQSEIWNLRAFADGRLLASTSKDGTAKLWNLEEAGAWRALYDLPAGTEVRGFSASGEHLLLYRRGDCRMPGLDIEGGEFEEVFSFEAVGADDCGRTVLSPDGQLGILGTGEDLIVVVDGRGGTRSVKVGEGRVQPVWISPRKTYALLFSDDAERLLLWNLERDVLVGELPGFGHWSQTAISPDESWLASFGPDDTIESWRLPGMERGPTLRGHSWQIRDLSFSPDGRLLASCDMDGNTRLWNIERGVEAMAPLQGHLGGVNRVDFSRDGRTLSTYSGDGTVRLWSVATGQEMLRFSNVEGFWTAPVIAPHGRAFIWSAPTSTEERWRNVEVTTIRPLAEIDRELEARRN